MPKEGKRKDWSRGRRERNGWLGLVFVFFFVFWGWAVANLYGFLEIEGFLRSEFPRGGCKLS